MSINRSQEKYRRQLQMKVRLCIDEVHRCVAIRKHWESPAGQLLLRRAGASICNSCWKTASGWAEGSLKGKERRVGRVKGCRLTDVIPNGRMVKGGNYVGR